MSLDQYAFSKHSVSDSEDHSTGWVDLEIFFIELGSKTPLYLDHSGNFRNIVHECSEKRTSKLEKSHYQPENHAI